MFAVKVMFVPSDEVTERLDRIESLLRRVLNKENQIMSLEQDVLTEITGLDSSVEAVVAWINSQPTDVIDAAGAQRVIAALRSDKAKLDVAIPASTGAVT